jgi:hypothetical protein
MMPLSSARNVIQIASLLLCACSFPWQRQPIGNEFNLAFTVEKNLLRLPSARINGHSGRFFFASAHAQSVMDPIFAAAVPSRRYRLELSERESLPIRPVVLDLRGLGDMLVGADAWNAHAVTIDYSAGLLTYQKEGIHPEEMSLFQFRAEPAILVDVDGQRITAIVDTALPDTLLLPRAGGTGDRRTAHVTIAGTDFGAVDVGLADIARARIGNRLLSKFLVTIDYGKQQVGLWRDPRIR